MRIRPLTDTNGNVDRWPAMEVVNGQPAISYRSDFPFQLSYVRAGDASGLTWGAAVLVDSGLGLDHTSMRVIGCHPAISYAGGEVRYVRAADTAGIVWGASVEVASASSDYRATLAEVGGQPAIAYYDSFQMKFLRQQSATIPSFTINWIALEP